MPYSAYVIVSEKDEVAQYNEAMQSSTHTGWYYYIVDNFNNVNSKTKMLGFAFNADLALVGSG